MIIHKNIREHSNFHDNWSILVGRIEVGREPFYLGIK